MTSGTGAIHHSHLTEHVNYTPRKKCCGVCLFRRNDPQGLQSDPAFTLDVEEMRDGWLTFFCVHTTDDRGRNQVCAGYHALFGRHRP